MRFKSSTILLLVGAIFWQVPESTGGRIVRRSSNYGPSNSRSPVKPATAIPVLSPADMQPVQYWSNRPKSRTGLSPAEPGTINVAAMKWSKVDVHCGKRRLTKDVLDACVWKVTTYHENARPEELTLNANIVKHNYRYSGSYDIDPDTYKFTIRKAQGWTVDLICVSRKRGEKKYTKHAAYRVTLKLPPPPPTKPPTTTTTPAPPTTSPKVTTPSVLLPPTTKAPFAFADFIVDTEELEVGEFTNAVLTCEDAESFQRRTEAQKQLFAWNTVVHFKDESKAEETYVVTSSNLVQNATLRSLFKIDPETFALTIRDVKEQAYKAACVFTGRDGSSTTDKTVIASYQVTVKEVSIITSATPCIGKVFIIGRPWCLTVTYKGIKLEKAFFIKFATEYEYSSNYREGGLRAATAAGYHIPPSFLTVRFNSLEKTDIAVWTCMISSGNHSKTAKLDLSDITGLEPAVKLSGVMTTEYQENAMILNKPWQTVLTIAGAPFMNLKVSQAGSLVYSCTSGGEEGGPRAEGASVEYNSTTGIITVTFDSFVEGDTAGLWTFDFGAGALVELDLSGATVLAGVVQVSTTTTFEGKFVRNEPWSMICSFPGMLKFGNLHLLQYRKFVYAYTVNDTEFGYRNPRVSSKFLNSTAVSATFDQFLSADETTWTCIVHFEDGSSYGQGIIDLTAVSYKEVCDNTAFIDGPVFKIPYARLTSSSVYGKSFMPEKGRLDLCEEPKVNCSWSAREAKSEEYIQVDLGRAVEIVKVATQGRGDDDKVKEWVTKYSMGYSFNGVDFTVDDNNGQNYTGNFDANTVVNNTLRTSVEARYVRLVVIEFNNHPSLRWEVYGCFEEGQPISSLSPYTEDLPPRITFEPPTPETLVRSKSCGGGASLRPPPEARHDELCRRSCEVKYESCTDICNSWFAPHDRRECEMRCSGGACSCGRQCMYKRPSHRMRPDGNPRLPDIGSGMRHVGSAGGKDGGMGGVDGMGSMAGRDSRFIASIDEALDTGETTAHPPLPPRNGQAH